ncbi:Family 61 glycosyl hydrolase [Coniochaeta hoffmannii]|uniref:lytic cellulose monooxygenase (C4-dehydrogenating) n=1 Tax=Coniochaeta hoffmannii TaxID=91930 RepID=A0AA38RSS5_9PEZI|nr:Family 61 glycosyl hydrolase [Coniochaeta hoffmannii]
MRSLPVVLSAISLVKLTWAHGYVDNATIGGVNYQFYQPYSDPYYSTPPQRVSRSIPGNGPVQDVTLSDLTCNTGAAPAPLHATAAAGSTVTLHWTLWPDSHVGPVITYMARCPDTGCQNWSPGSSAVWFKIKEGGRTGTTTTWADTPLMVSGNAGYQYTIPACLKKGYYLVRHEIIALHASYTYPGAQFYPGCHQLNVTGGGSTAPTGLVSLPGAYKGTDPGITYDAYKAQTYTIPGPKVFSC